MKKVCSLILIIAIVLSSFSIGAFAAGVATPTTWASNNTEGIKITWSVVPNAETYNVYRRSAGSTTWELLGTTAETVYYDVSVNNGKYYAYSVRAYNSEGNYSAYDKAKTYSVKCVNTPVLTSIKNVTSGIQINWTPVMSGCVYRVYRRGAGSSSWLYLGNTTSTSFVDGKATSGNYWRYTVRAVSSGFYSGFDTAGLYTMRLANPYSIKAVVKENYVSLSWARINGATNYRVYRRGAGETYWTYLGSVNSTNYNDYSIQKDKYYRYTVRAARGNVYSDFYTNGPVVICEEGIKKHLPIELVLSSGAGAWATTIQINNDCSFSGEFHDWDSSSYYPKGECYYCEFNGKFSDVREINKYTYEMRLESLKYKHYPGREWVEDDMLYISTEACGISGGDLFYFYVPGTPVSLLPQCVIDWGNMKGLLEGGYLRGYCLYNSSEEAPFF